MAFELSDWQKAAARAYGGGDFAHIAEQAFASREAFKEEIKNVGDTLFVFLMVELDTSEDCDGPAEAAQRISTAVNDLQAVLSAIENMPHPAAPAN